MTELEYRNGLALWIWGRDAHAPEHMTTEEIEKIFVRLWSRSELAVWQEERDR